MLKEQILERLASLGQKDLGFGVDALSPSQQEAFLSQLKKYDIHLLKRQREALFRPVAPPSSLQPLTQFDTVGSLLNKERGKRLISEGKVGCLLLAGGQGSRLKQAGQPKGTLPLSPIKGKSLLQLFLEKTRAASQFAAKALPLAVMTSPQNHAATLSFLEKNQWFGLTQEQCTLFLQGTLPFLDDKGDWVLEAPGVLAEGADGNGGVFTHFFDQGLWAKWKEKGIEYVNVILIDNPLADPFDAELIGNHAQAGMEVTLKCVFRRDENEKVGVVGATPEGKIRVIEYAELPEKEKSAKNPDGSLLWKVANISLFCFSMDFVKKMVRDPQFFLPWHIAKKSAPILKGMSREEAIIAKCETYIFDLLNFAERCKVMVYPREEAFAPWKNAAGEDSLQQVQAALLDKDRRTFKEITGLEPPARKFELDQAFYYPTSALLAKWKGRELPDQEYIEA